MGHTYDGALVDELLWHLEGRAKAVRELEPLEAEDAHRDFADYVLQGIRDFRLVAESPGTSYQPRVANDAAVHAPDCDLGEDCSCDSDELEEAAKAYRWSHQPVSVGRVVHYFTQDPETFEPQGPYVGHVVSCDELTGLAELEVLFPTEPSTGDGDTVRNLFGAMLDEGRQRMWGIPFSVEPKAGCWSWPSRV